MKLNIHSFQFNSFQENTFLVWDEDNSCLIFDPGCYSKQEQRELLDFIEKNDLNPVALLNTHAHIDHVLGNSFLMKTFDLDYYLHIQETKTLKSVGSYAPLYGFEGYDASPEPTKLLEHNQTIEIGKMKIKVFYTPGHSPGHVVFYFQEDNFVVNGDVLFHGSFGRVDLPGGNLETLKKSIYETMFNLPDKTVVYCGHGPETTIGREKQFNFIHQF
jgi:hydroxyacylglutathione hydrolase